MLNLHFCEYTVDEGNVTVDFLVQMMMPKYIIRHFSWRQIQMYPMYKGRRAAQPSPSERREGRESEELQQSDPRLIPLFGTPGLTHSPGGDAASGNFHLNV